MPRHFAIGNGSLLVNLDAHSCIRDIYFPYVGQLNHVGGYCCRIGVWVDGLFRWLSDPGWSFTLAYVPDSLVTHCTAYHKELGLTLTLQDGIHQRDNIYLKQITVRLDRMTEREVRLFFHQDLMIDETEVGDTALYYPENHTMVHYKRDKTFMFNGRAEQEGIHQYSAGVKRFHHAEGTWRDAEDGHLMGNPISQGSVDSVIAFRLLVPPGGVGTMHYWFVVAKTLEEAKALDRYVLESGAEQLLNRVNVYWQRWVGRCELDFGDLGGDVVQRFRQSLLLVRTQTDLRGAIIAANDTDILQSNRDHYSYMWPRDGALVAYAMSRAGFHELVAPFFRFCADALSPEGYLHHKYNPDGTVGSSWHPYLLMGKQQLPIQEDETALVLFALWQDYDKHRLIELPQALYPKLIRPAARFMLGYLDADLGLPKPSYDLWEERYGIFTFTCSAVYGGLVGAANFARLFGDDERADRYASAAESIKEAMLIHLWDEQLGRFVRGLSYDNGRWVKDTTLESSMYGIFEFGVLPAGDERVVRTMNAIREGLAVQTEVGGIARYRADYYFQRSPDQERVPGNPWIICTLWVAEWQIEAAERLEQLEAPRRTLEWVAQHALESGVLPEQLDPFDGSPVSVAPLTWSHSTYVLTVVKYAEKYAQLKQEAARASERQPALAP